MIKIFSTIREGNSSALRTLAVSFMASALLFCSGLAPAMAGTLGLSVDYIARFGSVDITGQVPKPGGGDGDYFAAALFFPGKLSGTDLIIDANTDPFLAFQYTLTNLEATAQSFFLRLALPIVPTGPIVQTDVFMDWQVFDTNGSGAASIVTGQAAANLGTNTGYFRAFVMPPFDPLYGVQAFGLTDADQVKRVMANTTATPDPTSALFNGSDTFTTLELQVLAGVLSPGDTVVIQAYACIADATQVCPESPDLNALFAPAVPVPAAASLFGSALGLLGWLRRKAS